MVQEFFHQHMLMVVSESGKSEMLKDRGHAVSGVQLGFHEPAEFLNSG